MGGGNKAPDTPKFQNSAYKFGNNTVSTTKKKGNTVTTQFNPTKNEKSAYNYLQNRLPVLYKSATTGQNFDDYTAKYIQNQRDAVGRDYNDSLRLLKNNFVNSGQVGSSIALNKLKPLQDSYLESMQDIEANAPQYSNQLRNSDLAYNSSLLENVVNGINQFYNTGNTFNSNATDLAQFGNNWANTQYQNQLQKYQFDKANSGGLMNSLIGGGAYLGGSLLNSPTAMKAIGAGAKQLGGMIMPALGSIAAL